MEFTQQEIDLAHSLVKGRYYKLGKEWVEDLIQEALFAVHRARQTFDFTEPEKWMPYINVTMRGTVKNYLRDRYNLIRKPRKLDAYQIISTDAKIREGEEDTLSEFFAFDYFIDKERAYFLQPYFDLMTEREKKIVGYKLDGLSDYAIADLMDTYQMKINRDLKALRKKIEEQDWFDAI